MTGERTEKALARMDLALRRIEIAGVRAKAALDTKSRQNETLRRAVTETLRDLDQMINHAEGEAGGA